MKPLFKIILAFLLLQSSLRAASVRLEWSIETGQTLQNRAAFDLSAGSGIQGDGTLIQLGYYSLASHANPFAGSWNTLFEGTMGDKSIQIDGQFALSSLFDGTDPNLVEPSVGTPLSIRFFDGVTEQSSSYYNATSDTSGSWDWVAISDPQSIITMEIDKEASQVWEDGLMSAFRTTITVPEPSSILFILLGSVIFLSNRKRS